eukprot:4133650-Heterocapsa_arctica.AAC.1
MAMQKGFSVLKVPSTDNHFTTFSKFSKTHTPNPHPKATPRVHTELGWCVPPGGISQTIHRIVVVTTHRIAVG